MRTFLKKLELMRGRQASQRSRHPNLNPVLSEKARFFGMLLRSCLIIGLARVAYSMATVLAAISCCIQFPILSDSSRRGTTFLSRLFPSMNGMIWTKFSKKYLCPLQSFLSFSSAQRKTGRNFEVRRVEPPLGLPGLVPAGVDLAFVILSPSPRNSSFSSSSSS